MSIAGNPVRRLHGAPQRGVIGGNKLGSHVPHEYVGLARHLRNQISAAYTEFDSGVERLFEPFHGTNRSSLSRGTLLRRFAADWRALPSFGRLRIKIDQEDGGVAIDEARLCPTSLLRTDWDEPEPSIAITLFSIRIAPRTATDKVRVLAIVGLHGLGRRYERGEDRGDLSVLRDLLPIVTAWPSAIRNSGDFEIPAGCGAWRGEVASITLAGETMTALSVRTFVA